MDDDRPSHDPADGGGESDSPRDVDPVARELSDLERLAASSVPAAVTAQVLGVPPLAGRAPTAYWEIFEQYMCILDQALDRRAYRDAARPWSGDLRAIAERLGALGAGAQEVADLHARALRQKTRLSSGAKAHAYAAEGRLVAFELMGHLLSHYRRRACVRPAGADG